MDPGSALRLSGMTGINGSCTSQSRNLVIPANAGIHSHQLELLSESRRPVRKIMTAAAYGSRIGARVARWSGTTWVGWHDRDSAFSRHESARGVTECFALFPKQREQGMPGARCTCGLVCKMHKGRRTRAYRFSGGSPAFPAQWLYGLCRALPGDEFLFVTVVGGF